MTISLIALAITDFVVTVKCFKRHIFYIAILYQTKNFAQRGIKKSRMPGRVNASSRMNCGHEGTGGGVIRDPTGLPATSQNPSPPADGPLIRGEFLTDLRENKSV